MTTARERTRRAVLKVETVSSTICQQLRTPSVSNQSQNAPPVIPQVLLVCLPCKRLGNQHRNYIQQHRHHLWMVFFSPLLINGVLPGTLLLFQISFKKISAFNKPARHKVLYRVTERRNAEQNKKGQKSFGCCHTTFELCGC